MGAHDRRLDAYIAKAAEFAQPILDHIRELVHKGCPEVQEQIKWGMPYFTYKGMMCHMAAFKSHCAMGFWKSSLLPDPEDLLERRKEKTAMGQLGRIQSLKDLPPDSVIIAYVKSAATLNESGTKRPRTSTPRPPQNVRPPTYFKAALKKRRGALEAFEGFSASQKRDYVQWLTEAKTAETRQRRLDTAVQWIAGGKTRNWKYKKSRG
jgi:uncharacterized protein YdeI (YjbR/CyaY-like superfamily)